MLIGSSPLTLTCPTTKPPSQPKKWSPILRHQPNHHLNLNLLSLDYPTPTLYQNITPCQLYVIKPSPSIFNRLFLSYYSCTHVTVSISLPAVIAPPPKHYLTCEPSTINTSIAPPCGDVRERGEGGSLDLV